MIELLNIDCMEYMATCKDKQFDLAIVDPPYGININANMGLAKGQRKRHVQKDWDAAPPDDQYFVELFRISYNQIIWGGNYFWLPPTYHFISWYKHTPKGMSFSDCEYAWTSFNKANRVYAERNIYDGKIHPTQKSVQLYKWLLKNYATPDMKIIDTHLGSGSSAIACYDFGCDFVGCEIDKEYYESAKHRFETYKLQTKLCFT